MHVSSVLGPGSERGEDEMQRTRVQILDRQQQSAVSSLGAAGSRSSSWLAW